MVSPVCKITLPRSMETMPMQQYSGSRERFIHVLLHVPKIALFLSVLMCGDWFAHAEQAGPLSTAIQDSRLATYNSKDQVAGTLKIHGSDTMHPLLMRLAMEFRRHQPLVSIDVTGGGSGKALAEFLVASGAGSVGERKSAATLLVSSSRELMPPEISQFSSVHGYAPIGIPVAVDAVAVYVHRDNPITGLTLDQVDAMFSLSRNRGYLNTIDKWGQFGLTNGWENAPIHLFGRDRKSGTRVFFQEHVLLGGEFQPSMQVEPGAASVILALSRSLSGIAFNGLGLHSTMVRIVPLAEKTGQSFVSPSDSTIADQTYPLRRMLYLYMDMASPGQISPSAKEFFSFVTSREGQDIVVRSGFFPLPVGQIERAMSLLQASSSKAH